MTTITAIVTAIVTALTADLGTIDLSTTDQVQEGTFVRPPGSEAFAAVLPPRLLDSQGQARNLCYLETYEVVVRLWAPVPAATHESRVARSRLLQAEAQKALDGARDDTSTAIWRCVRWAVTGGDPHPAPAGAADWAHVALTITLTYRRGTGTGA